MADVLSKKSAASTSALAAAVGTPAAAAAPAITADYRRLMNLLLQLRKVCNHPYLLANAADDTYGGGDDDGDGDGGSGVAAAAGGLDALVEASGKLQLLDRMLPRLRAEGHRVLLFTQFTSMLDILEEFCAGRGHEYCRLDGSTNRVQRRLDIRRFNAPASPLFIFLISTRAGGLGELSYCLWHQ